jgi:FKBP-type peptidyl-prolyl cis-trans isomerase
MRCLPVLLLCAACAHEPTSWITPSGLRMTELSPGRGPKLVDGDIAVVRWVATRDDGQVHEDHRTDDPPMRIVVADQGMIWWHEGLQQMRAGGTYRFDVPLALMWPAPLRPAAVAAVKSFRYEVRVLDVVPAPIFAKPDPARAKTADGFVYEVIAEGAGDPPAQGAACELHFACWDAEGALVEHTRGLGKPVRIDPAKNPPPFLRDVVRRMKKGTRLRCSCPVELAYPRGHSVYQPKATLYWDIELLGFGA